MALVVAGGSVIAIEWPPSGGKQGGTASASISSRKGRGAFFYA